MSGTRMFFCDPPGVSTVDAIKNFGYDNDPELHYIWLHDQEPIHLDIHQELFKQVWFLNQDLHLQGPMNSGIITSEWNSEFVDQVCSQYFWSKKPVSCMSGTITIIIFIMAGQPWIGIVGIIAHGSCLILLNAK